MSWLHRHLAQERNEAGTTFIEMLVVVIILPLIVGAIATAVITALNDQKGVSGKLSDSASAQTTSAFYVRDVQSAAYVTTSSASTPSPCGSGTSFLLGLSWGSPTAGGVVVSYWEVPTPGNPTPATNDLVRLYCSGGSTTPASTVTVAHGVSTTAGIRAAVDFARSISSPPNPAVSWVPTSGISTITLQAQESSSNYNFDLVAAPRGSVSTVGNGGNPAPPPLLLLGSGTNVLNCVGGGNGGTVNVIGTAYLNSTANGAGSLGPNASLTATQIYTADPTPSGAISGTYSPSPPINGPVISDPYAGLTPPSTTGLNDYTTGTNYQGPGIYENTLTLNGNNTTVLQTGTYILRQGIKLKGGASLTSGPGGVLLYVTGGSIDFGGGGNVSLQPLSPPPYPSAPNLGIWQNNPDPKTNAVSLSGNGTATYGGTVYAPAAQVTGGGAFGYTAGSIIASSYSCNGTGTATIG
jgi:hypothetical protein